MERRIDLSNLDLDRAATLIAGRVPEWTSWGLTAHPLTWMDNDQGWPRPVVLDRRAVRRPMSLGLVVESGEELVCAQFVLYAGGWADVDYLPSGGEDVLCEYLAVEEVAEFGPFLDRVVAQLRPGPVPGS